MLSLWGSHTRHIKLMSKHATEKSGQDHPKIFIMIKYIKNIDYN